MEFLKWIPYICYINNNIKTIITFWRCSVSIFWSKYTYDNPIKCHGTNATSISRDLLLFLCARNSPIWMCYFPAFMAFPKKKISYMDKSAQVGFCTSKNITDVEHVNSTLNVYKWRYMRTTNKLERHQRIRHKRSI